MPPGALHFAKRQQKRLFILFCQFLLGKKLFLGPEGGVGAFIRGVRVKSVVYGILNGGEKRHKQT